jgi:hypothetical protein
MSVTPTTDPFSTGRHFRSLTVTPYVADPVDGSMTASTPMNVYAVFEELDHTTEDDFDDIRPTWQLQKNMVLTGYGHRCRLTTLKIFNSANQLTLLKEGSTHCRVQWEEGDESFDGWFATGRLDNGTRGFGAQHVSLDLEPFNPGASINQVTYTTPIP